MDRSHVDRACRGDIRLGGDEATIEAPHEALATLSGAAEKGVHASRLQLESSDEAFDWIEHRAAV
jgi:hypothetical protein